MYSGKPLAVIKSIKKARTIDPADPKIHSLTARFLHALPSWTLNPVVDEVVKEEVAALFGGKSMQALNEEFLAQHSKSLSHVVAGNFSFLFPAFCGCKYLMISPA